MKWSNLVHNILNVLIAVVGGVTVYLVTTGCVTVNEALDCSGSSLPPAAAALTTTILGIVKTALNMARDGLAGLYKAQPKINP